MKEDLTLEKIREAIENERVSSRQLINHFFDILFWKDYSKGYVKTTDKSIIVDEIEKSTSAFPDVNLLDTKKILPFINKIRKQIGLPELTTKLNNSLQEIDEEVRKKLILKGLE